MLRIRFQRIGKKKQAHFRIVLLEHTSKPQGAFIELLGTYNPHSKALSAQAERIQYWISKGAQLSPTVHNLLVTNGVLKSEKVQSWKPKKKAQATATSPAPAAAPTA